MAKKELLQVGQKIWLETTFKLGCDVRYEDKPSEMIVLEANNSSAYIWYIDDKQSKVKFKVNQKTHQVKYPIPDGRSYRLWLSIEDYENHVAYEKEMKELLKQAHEKVDTMSLDDLRKLVIG